MHLARAGWLRWRDDIPDKPARPGKSPLAFRLVLDDGSGFDLTEAGTQKRLAVYLVRDPADVPGVATLGPEPLADDFTADALAAILAGRRTQIKGVLRDQHIIAGIGNAYSDEVLHVAKMSPFKLASSFTPEEVAALHDGDREHAPRRGEAVGRAWPRPTSRARRRPGCGCTARPASPARSAATRSARSPSPIRRCSTAPPARPAASRSPTAACPGCSSSTARPPASRRSGGAADRLSPADEVDVGRRHPRRDPGLQLDLGQRGGHQLTAVRALRRLPRRRFPRRPPRRRRAPRCSWCRPAR